jgi:hypothetical protein
MKNKREFDTSYFHNPHSPGDELLPLHHGEEGDGVDGGKGATGIGSDSGSLLSSLSLDQLCVFCVCPLPSCEITRGVRGYIYLVLGQDDSVESKIASKQRTTGKLGPTRRPGLWPAWCALFPTSRHSMLTSSYHGHLSTIY